MQQPNLWRKDFPILERVVKDKPLCYLDSAASSQKPKVVVDCISDFYNRYNANIHRGVYSLSQESTDRYEAARLTVSRFLNARDSREIVFTRNATEAINLVATSVGMAFFKPGDEIVLTLLEHHANIVPWQLLAERLGLVIQVIPLLESGDLDLEAYERLLGPKTRIVAFTAASNAIGTITPADTIIQKAKAVGALTLIDACQAVPHFKIDVQALGVDFCVFTGHKLFGPNGIGVLYGRFDLLCNMPPYQGGGEMIEKVTFEKTTFRLPPERFEAGTPAIADAIGLGAAIDYFESLDKTLLVAHEETLLKMALELLGEIPGLKIMGLPEKRLSLLSFVLRDVHAHDLATYLDTSGICVRAGHHCAQPLLRHLGYPATTRASFALYNTIEEVEHLAKALYAAGRFFS